MDNIIETGSIKHVPIRKYVWNDGNNWMEIKQNSLFGEKHVIHITPVIHLQSALNAIYGKGEIVKLTHNLGDLLEKDGSAIKLDSSLEGAHFFIPDDKTEGLLKNRTLSFLKDPLANVKRYLQERTSFDSSGHNIRRISVIKDTLAKSIPHDYSMEGLGLIVKRHEETHSTQEVRFHVSDRLDRAKKHLNGLWANRKAFEIDTLYYGIEAEIWSLCELQASLAEVRRQGKPPNDITEEDRKAVRLNAAKAVELLYKHKRISANKYQPSMVEIAATLIQNNMRGAAAPHRTALFNYMLGSEGLGDSALLGFSQKPADVNMLGHKLLTNIELAVKEPDKFISQVLTQDFAQKVDLKLMKSLNELEQLVYSYTTTSIPTKEKS